jgi:CDP-2,3-bis-(O-geranylgeranyl)-sn-glycerol synthase
MFLGFILSLGALVGDLFGSFIKRRLDIKPGASLPLIDQLSFVLFALLFALIAEPNSISLLSAILIVILTGPVHLLVNFIAYILRLKDNPW